MKLFKHLIIGLLLSLFLIQEVSGKRRGFRSSFSKFSNWGSKSSSSKSYSRSWGSGKQSSSTKASSTSTRSSGSSGTYSSHSKKGTTTSTTSKMSSVDKQLAKRAKQNGTSFQTREAATKAFQQKNARKYTSTYSSKPTTRPAHIPGKTKYNGKDYDVIYDKTRGGYGHFGPSGKWIAYNVMKDAAMLSLLMRNNNYYYPTAHNNHHYSTGLLGSSVRSLGTLLFIVIIGAASAGTSRGIL